MGMTRILVCLKKWKMEFNSISESLYFKTPCSDSTTQAKNDWCMDSKSVKVLVCILIDVFIKEFVSFMGRLCSVHCNATDNIFLFNICMLQIRNTRQDKYERRSRGKSVRCSQAGSCSATDGTCWAPIESWGDTLESGSPSNLHKTLKRVMIEGNIVESWGESPQVIQLISISLFFLPINVFMRKHIIEGEIFFLLYKDKKFIFDLIPNWLPAQCWAVNTTFSFRYRTKKQM